METHKTVAFLSNKNEYTIFSFGDYTITFLTSKNLICYTKIKTWDNGYIVVDAKYNDCSQDVEEYIDLVPILENLNIDPSTFLKPIKAVKINKSKPSMVKLLQQSLIPSKYKTTFYDDFIKIVEINYPNDVIILSSKGKIVETNMNINKQALIVNNWKELIKN